jgi:hypothetical protein
MILPTRRWTCKSAEYSGSPISGDFVHARKSSRSTSFSIVIVVLRYNNNPEVDWFKFTSLPAQTVLEFWFVSICVLRLSIRDNQEVAPF